MNSNSFRITPLTVSINAHKAAELTPSPDALARAADAFAARTDSFAEGKAQICRDIAHNLRKYGSYASTKQQEFAAKLVAWSKPRDAKPASDTLRVPALFDIMQRHSTFHVADTKIQRKNQDSLCWIVVGDLCVGKIEDAAVTLFTKRMNEPQREALIAILREFDADPLGTAMKYGKLSGRCCSCGRDLTDPESIERGIGPVCAEKFA